MPENCFLKLFVPFSKWGQFGSRKKVFVDDTKVFPKLLRFPFLFLNFAWRLSDMRHFLCHWMPLQCRDCMSFFKKCRKSMAWKYANTLFSMAFLSQPYFLPLVYRLSYGLFVGKTNRLCGKATPYRNELLKNSLQKSCFQTTQGQF